MAPSWADVIRGTECHGTDVTKITGSDVPKIRNVAKGATNKLKQMDTKAHVAAVMTKQSNKNR